MRLHDERIWGHGRLPACTSSCWSCKKLFSHEEGELQSYKLTTPTSRIVFPQQSTDSDYWLDHSGRSQLHMIEFQAKCGCSYGFLRVGRWLSLPEDQTSCADFPLCAPRYRPRHHGDFYLGARNCWDQSFWHRRSQESSGCPCPALSARLGRQAKLDRPNNRAVPWLKWFLPYRWLVIFRAIIIRIDLILIKADY